MILAWLSPFEKYLNTSNRLFDYQNTSIDTKIIALCCSVEKSKSLKVIRLEAISNYWSGNQFW